MAPTSLNDVHRSIAIGETVNYGPMMVFVVDYITKFRHPWQFLIAISSREAAFGQYNEEDSLFLQSPHSFLDRYSSDIIVRYRFDVILEDATFASKRLRARLPWYALDSLMGTSAEEFQKLSEADQIAYVERLMWKRPKCQVDLQVKGRDVSIGRFEVLTPQSRPPVSSTTWPPDHTPVLPSYMPSTQHSSMPSTSSPRDSSTPRFLTPPGSSTPNPPPAQETADSSMPSASSPRDSSTPLFLTPPGSLTPSSPIPPETPDSSMPSTSSPRDSSTPLFLTPPGSPTPSSPIPRVSSTTQERSGQENESHLSEADKVKLAIFKWG